MLDINKIRQDFPQVLETKVHNKPLVYLDSAATTLKPRSVVDTLSRYYQFEAANIHRGIHFLSDYNTGLFEKTREHVRLFLNAHDSKEIIFTRGTTDSINFVAQSYGRNFLKEGDEIVISTMEHHSNIVPWQILCEEKGLKLKVVPISDEGEILFEEYLKLLNEKTKMVSIMHVSNVLGTVNPVKKIIQAAKKFNAVTVIDGAQAVAHMKIDVLDLDCDFYAFSGHKIFGPTGIGVLYGKENLLDQMPPIQGGGEMIDQVTFEKTTFNDLPYKFEAGTPHIAGVLGLDAALDYVDQTGLVKMAAHEKTLLEHGTRALETITGVKILGRAAEKGPVLTFVLEGAHPQDIATLIDLEGVAIRTGHHCAQPLMERFGITASARASFSVYNTVGEIDLFVEALIRVKELL